MPSLKYKSGGLIGVNMRRSIRVNPLNLTISSCALGKKKKTHNIKIDYSEGKRILAIPHRRAERWSAIITTIFLMIYQFSVCSETCQFFLVNFTPPVGFRGFNMRGSIGVNMRSKYEGFNRS